MIRYVGYITDRVTPQTAGADVSASNPLPVDVGADLTVNAQFNSLVIAPTQFATPFGANENRVTPYYHVADYACVGVSLKTDQASATNGAKVIFSRDGTDAGICRIATATITSAATAAGQGLHFSVDREGEYVKFDYTNGATAQTSIQVDIIASFIAPPGSKLPAGATITDLNTGLIGNSLLRGHHSSGAWLPLDVTLSGSVGVLKTDGSGYTQPVSGPLTDTQLRASAVPVSAAQSGAWTVARNWNLGSGSDSVAAVQSGTWNVGTVTAITNVVHVDDNAGSLTVDNAGTFAVQAAQSGTWSTDRTWNLSSGSDSVLVSSQANGSATGTITALAQTVSLALPAGTSSTEIQLTGTFVGTVAFESSVDGGTTWNARVYRSSGILNNLQTSTSTSPSEWRGNSAGMSHIRVRCTAYTSGTLTVVLKSTEGVGAVFLNAAIPVGGQSTGNVYNSSLASGADTGGTFENLENVSEISINLSSNKNCSIQYIWSQDGTTTFVADPAIAITANTSYYERLTSARGQYLKIVVTNTDSTPANVRLDTVYRAVGGGSPALPLSNTSSIRDAMMGPIGSTQLFVRTGTNAYSLLPGDAANGLDVDVTRVQGIVTCKTDQTTHGTTDLVAADITKVGGSAVTLGQKTKANSIPVTLPSDGAGAPYGTWGYTAGVSGTVTMTGSKRVLSITAIAQGAAASFTVNSGDTVTLPYDTLSRAGSAVTLEPKGNLTDPTIVFTSTKSYVIEYVT